MRRGMLLSALMALLLAPGANAMPVTQAGSMGGKDTLTTFEEVLGLEKVTSVDASNASGYALEQNGTVHAWGTNKHANLCNGNTKKASPDTAVTVPFPAGVRITSLGEAEGSLMAIDSEHNGWACGSNPQGTLCQKPTGNIVEPVKVISGVQAVQGGEHHSLWLTTGGTVKACGSNLDGRLGVQGVKEAEEPVEVPGLSGVAEITAGVTTSAARTTSGKVFAWGANQFGQLGLGSRSKEVDTPTPVSDLPEAAVQISAGGDFHENGSMVAITAAGLLYGWGDNECGQVFGASERTIDTPFDTGLHFTQAVTGGTDTFALDKEGNVYGAGCATGGELGNGATEGSFPTPSLVASDASQVSATAEHTVILHP
jgi:alpha-tubulin suppressor-like RCC1 family protein